MIFSRYDGDDNATKPSIAPAQPEVPIDTSTTAPVNETSPPLVDGAHDPGPSIQDDPMQGTVQGSEMNMSWGGQGTEVHDFPNNNAVEEESQPIGIKEDG